MSGRQGKRNRPLRFSTVSDEPMRFRARFVPFDFDDSGLVLLEDGQVAENDLSTYLRAAPLEFEGSITFRAVNPPLLHWFLLAP